jgi:amidase
MRSGDWTATEVTLAYCKSAAVAHQVVNCLIDIDIDGALQRARELDEVLRSTGKVIGPLHGLPISIKVSTTRRGSLERDLTAVRYRI